MPEATSLTKTVPHPRTRWILPGIVPFQELVLVDGATGVGKSCFLAELAAVESQRVQAEGDKGVLYLSSTFQADIRTYHLHRQQANLDNIHQVTFFQYSYFEQLKAGTTQGTPLEHFIEFLTACLKEHRPSLVIIDSLEELLPLAAKADDSEWRRFWRALLMLSYECECTIVVPRLHGKHEGRHYGAAARTGTETARYILTLHWHPYDAGKRVLTLAKSLKDPMGAQFHLCFNTDGKLDIVHTDVHHHVRPAKSPQTWHADPDHVHQTQEIVEHVNDKMQARPIPKQELQEHIVSLGYSQRAYLRTMSQMKLSSVRHENNWYYIPSNNMICLEQSRAAAAAVEGKAPELRKAG